MLGAPFACDMYALTQIFNIPGIVFGPTGTERAMPRTST